MPPPSPASITAGANDGRLVGVPYLKEAYFGELERDRWAMRASNHRQFYGHWAQLMAADRRGQVPTNANGEGEAMP